jgi:hypothetical protein
MKISTSGGIKQWVVGPPRAALLMSQMLCNINA